MKILIIGKYSFIGVNLLKALRKFFSTKIISSRDFFKDYQKYAGYNYIINCALNKKYITNKYNRIYDLDFKIGCIIKKFKSKYILLSSRKVYRPAKNIKEKNKVNPISNYGKNKYKTEQVMLNLLGNRLLVLRISNIIGIRNSKTKGEITNKFDDIITISFKDEDGVWQYYEYNCTTDPGDDWMENPWIADKGCAVLKPGQYRGSHKLRLHSGKYLALGQKKDVTVYRDNNRNDKYEFDESTCDTGVFGINIHRATALEGKTSTYVNKWSAGCQVIASNDDFDNGETEFPIFGDKVKPEKGKLLAFPPLWQYLHRGNPPTGNGYAKYFLMTYLNYIEK